MDNLKSLIKDVYLITALNFNLVLIYIRIYESFNHSTQFVKIRKVSSFVIFNINLFFNYKSLKQDRSIRKHCLHYCTCSCRATASSRVITFSLRVLKRLTVCYSDLVLWRSSLLLHKRTIYEDFYVAPIVRVGIILPKIYGRFKV